MRKGGGDALNGQVSGLALVFDHAVGHVYVDNICVQVKSPGTRGRMAGTTAARIRQAARRRCRPTSSSTATICSRR
jgi:hypothetical protein